jgi:hypothetical protein
MNTIEKYKKAVLLAMVIALALLGAPNTTAVQAQDSDDKGTVSIPLGSAGLAFGEGLRTTLTNLGKGHFNLQIKVMDAEGLVVKQESLVLEAGQIRAFEISRSEVERSERAVMLRTEVIARPADGDGKDLWMSSEIIDWASGSTRFQIYANAGCSGWACTSNHNETLVRDSTRFQVATKPGTGCSGWQCTSNHNETLVRDMAPMK